MKEIVDFLLRELRGAWRFRWAALAATGVIAVCGWFLVLSLPDIYAARARVFVDTSSRLRDVLGRIAFQPDVESRVQVVRQAMLGRPQLEKVASSTGLDARARTPEEHARLIDSLLLNIQISAGRNDPTLYTIVYQDPDRQMALAVVDTLVKTFVADVIEHKEEGSRAAESFLIDQVHHYEEQLATAEQNLANFKKENIGLMPGESGDYFARLQRENESLQQLQAQLQIVNSKKQELERQLSGETLAAAAAGSSSTTTGSAASLDDPMGRRIAQLESELQELLLRYTDRHPDVIAKRAQIARLREQRDEQVAQLVASGQGDTLSQNPVIQNIRIALNDANVQAAALAGEVAERQRRIAQLRSVLDTAPEVEAELARLTRDYGSTRAMYDQLLSQLERERLVNEGDERNVVSFELLDPPTSSLVPVSPKRGFLLLAATVFAFGVGGAVAYLLSQMKPVFFDAATLRRVLELPVLGEVSMTWLEKGQARRRLGHSAYAVSLAVLVVGFLSLMVLRQPASALLREFLRTLSS